MRCGAGFPRLPFVAIATFLTRNTTVARDPDFGGLESLPYTDKSRSLKLLRLGGIPYIRKSRTSHVGDLRGERVCPMRFGRTHRFGRALRDRALTRLPIVDAQPRHPRVAVRTNCPKWDNWPFSAVPNGTTLKLIRLDFSACPTSSPTWSNTWLRPSP